MFSHFRYFAIVSFSIILAFTLLIGTYFRYLSAEGLLKDVVHHHNISLVKILENQMFSTNQDLINQLNTFGIQEVSKKREFLEWAQKIIKFSEKMNVSKLNLYDNKGNKFLSSASENVTENNNLFLSFWNKMFSDHNNNYKHNLQETLKGQVISTLVNVNEGKKTLVRTLYPIKINNNIIGVAETLFDITEPWNYLFYFQIAATFSIMLIYLIMFGLLFYSSSQAESIIDKQLEKNKSLQEEKEKAETENKQKSRFLANVSHELRTPLNAIIGFSEIITKEKHGPIENEKYKEYIKDINYSGTHLLSLINDILDFSKAEAEKLEIYEEEIDLNKIISNCVRIMQSKAAQAGVNLIQQMPNEHIIIKADAKRIKQVILNLLSNSVKFTPDGGKIIVNLEIAGEKVLIKTQDTGIGINPKDIAKALSTFGQVDNKLSRKYEGTGLGLPLSKKLVELMKGNFYLESEEGLGTLVIIEFAYLRKIELKNEEANEIVTYEKSPIQEEAIKQEEVKTNNNFNFKPIYKELNLDFGSDINKHTEQKSEPSEIKKADQVEVFSFAASIGTNVEDDATQETTVDNKQEESNFSIEKKMFKNDDKIYVDKENYYYLIS